MAGAAKRVFCKTCVPSPDSDRDCGHAATLRPFPWGVGFALVLLLLEPTSPHVRNLFKTFPERISLASLDERIPMSLAIMLPFERVTEELGENIPLHGIGIAILELKDPPLEAVMHE